MELATRYLRERSIPVARVFTISALDYFEAANVKRAAAPWNELGALRDTLHAHAEEHMRRYGERVRREADLARGAAATPAAEPSPPGAPVLRRALDRFFGRR
ncbi:MAG: hypothetical protein NVSMB19_01900 [Vulcanimicrobiaceae bacterium]